MDILAFGSCVRKAPEDYDIGKARLIFLCSGIKDGTRSFHRRDPGSPRGAVPFGHVGPCCVLSDGRLATYRYLVVYGKYEAHIQAISQEWKILRVNSEFQ